MDGQRGIERVYKKVPSWQPSALFQNDVTVEMNFK